MVSILEAIDGGRADEGRDWALELRSERLHIRQAAAHHFAKHPGEARAVLGELAAALGDRDPQVRKGAARALSAVGPDALAVLVASLGHRRPVAREWAAVLLGRLGPAAQAAEGALRAAAWDSDYTVRWAALEALKRAFPGKLEHLQRGDSPCAP